VDGTSAEGDQPAVPSGAPAERVVSDGDKKLAKEWLTRIEAGLKRVKDKFASFESNRSLLAGKVAKGEKETVRANLHFANMAAMLPQVYAKDPEFAAKPTEAVGQAQMEAVKKFAATAEILLKTKVVKGGHLKARSKSLLRSGYSTSVGWLKASWQETKAQDPLIANRLKDTQDNTDHVQRLLNEASDPKFAAQRETKLAELRQALEGLKTPQEVTVARGIALDFVMTEDVVILDPSVRAIGDYTRAAAIAHRVWMTPEQYKETFQYDAKKGKSYTEQNGAMTESSDKASTLLCVWEIWSQADNRVFHVCDGEDGFCRPPDSPDWTGKRWYPFFLLAWNEIDGGFYPLSDIEMTDKLVKEYNEQREDFVRDRRECLPITIIRKGGSLTDADVKNISNAKGGDKVLVEGVGGQPISNDVWNGAMGTLDSKNYDTTATRYDMERILGGSDTTTGSITKAKTLGEAQMLSAAVQSRNGDRRDTLEDLLNELGPYCVEVMLRKYSEAEVQKIAGPDASWPRHGAGRNLRPGEHRGARRVHRQAGQGRGAGDLDQAAADHQRGGAEGRGTARAGPGSPRPGHHRAHPRDAAPLRRAHRHRAVPAQDAPGSGRPDAAQAAGGPDGPAGAGPADEAQGRHGQGGEGLHQRRGHHCHERPACRRHRDVHQPAGHAHAGRAGDPGAGRADAARAAGGAARRAARHSRPARRTDPQPQAAPPQQSHEIPPDPAASIPGT
jgi:hypothetical protein